ncbi:MAG TPA: galactose oxidase-like domain-containing protein [Ramlibacter sp.]|nr:galactose oxidase-like domain-containing protein [Ramlibacter sp.]
MNLHKFLRLCSTGVLSCLLGATSLLAPGMANAQANVVGQWSKLQNLPEAPIHNVLLPNGKILMWGRGSVERLWDPVTQAITAVPHVGYDLFCAGHGLLPDGRVLVPGGHIADYVGLAKTSIYNPATNSWTTVPDMNAGRWYPTVTTLPNGDALVVSGQIDTSVGVNPLPQVYQTATNTWRNLTGAQLSQALYPMMFVAPNGKLIDVAPTHYTRYLDTSGTGSWTFAGWRTFGWRDYGTAAMYADGKIVVLGGADPPTATAEVINLNVPTPSWRAVPSMSVARRHPNATLLPDGTVLVTGGTYGAGHNNASTPVFVAELWNPATETFTRLANATVPRLYHSSAMLLPDGRVVTNGGDGYADVEVFSPPYLFKGARPTMSSVPASIGYGQSFTVQAPEAAGIQKVNLIRIGSPTHAFDMNQRLNVLQFTRGSGTLAITPPANANLAPPGHYMLFIVNGNGVPSVGGIVLLGGTAPPPPPPGPALSSLSPSSATAGGPAFTLTVNGSDFVSGVTVRWNGAARSTSFVSATRLTAAIPAGDIAAQGTAQVSVLNPSGAASGNLPFTVGTAPPSTFALSVTKAGSASGNGTVTSNPAGISCGGTCSAAFGSGSNVTLSVSISSGGVFAGWSGACTGTATTCTVNMNANKAVTATINASGGTCVPYPAWNPNTRYVGGEKVTRLGKYYIAKVVGPSVWNVNSAPEWTPQYWDLTTCP